MELHFISCNNNIISSNCIFIYNKCFYLPTACDFAFSNSDFFVFVTIFSCRDLNVVRNSCNFEVWFLATKRLFLTIDFISVNSDFIPSNNFLLIVTISFFQHYISRVWFKISQVSLCLSWLLLYIFRFAIVYLPIVNLFYLQHTPQFQLYFS